MVIIRILGLFKNNPDHVFLRVGKIGGVEVAAPTESTHAALAAFILTLLRGHAKSQSVISARIAEQIPGLIAQDGLYSRAAEKTLAVEFAFMEVHLEKGGVIPDGAGKPGRIPKISNRIHTGCGHYME